MVIHRLALETWWTHEEAREMVGKNRANREYHSPDLSRLFFSQKSWIVQVYPDSTFKGFWALWRNEKRWDDTVTFGKKKPYNVKKVDVTCEIKWEKWNECGRTPFTYPSTLNNTNNISYARIWTIVFFTIDKLMLEWHVHVCKRLFS